MYPIEKIVVVTKKTALDELVERMNTRDQAKFYIEHMGGSFEAYQVSHDRYALAKKMLLNSIPSTVRFQEIDRRFLPNFVFGDKDLVITLGPDGLIVNTAKYLNKHYLLAFNPDVQTMDGVLIPFVVEEAKSIIANVLRDQLRVRPISMAKAQLNDGQVLYAVNDLFIGQKTHVSARYRIRIGPTFEDQSSSGIIVSTGAGSTGWYRSILTGAAAVIENQVKDKNAGKARTTYRFSAESTSLKYCVREPFISRVSGATLIFGDIPQKQHLQVESQMPQNGIIFSDGIESDYLDFNSGSIAEIALAEKKLNLLVV
jgi:NAD kinase